MSSINLSKSTFPLLFLSILYHNLSIYICVIFSPYDLITSYKFSLVIKPLFCLSYFLNTFCSYERGYSSRGSDEIIRIKVAKFNPPIHYSSYSAMILYAVYLVAWKLHFIKASLRSLGVSFPLLLVSYWSKASLISKTSFKLIELVTYNLGLKSISVFFLTGCENFNDWSSRFSWLDKVVLR